MALWESVTENYSGADTGELQSLTFDDFMYFFLRLRKPRIRAVVENVRTRLPDGTPEELARLIIDSHAPISLLAGALLHCPRLIPGLGQTLQALGVVMGASALTRMQLYMILEIALLYGKDIDDQARVPELMAVVAATGASVAVPFLVDALGFNPFVSIPIAGLTATATSRLMGEMAIRYYSESLPEAASAAVEPS
jgi:hypothetical protein